jgi:dTDP-glucose pyrophosphorylase
MQRADAGANIDAEQARIADAGIKAMIPLRRPFLEYAISALADAGITDVCLVIGPAHDAIREHFAALCPARVRIHFATQQEPRGTSDAVAAAESFASGDTVLAVNADNYYPVGALRALRKLCGAGAVAFERSALVERGNFDAVRVASFAVLVADDHGMLDRIIEKPSAAQIDALQGDVLVGMNAWSLPPEIFHACRAIAPSARGELELTDAVQYAHDALGVRFRVIVSREGVLDLSTRADIASAARHLEQVEPEL